jgi:nicotinate phosphoribosyltransferase
MSVFDQKRLTNAQIQLDIDGLRRGIYSDKYFANVVQILEGLQQENYGFAGQSPRSLPSDPTGFPVGESVVEAQLFNRREPYTIVAGTDVALAMLRHCAGHFEDDAFVEGWQSLDVTAVQDGVFTHYKGDPNNVETVIEIRGPYRDFALLETPMLGALSRASRIVTNVYDVLQAANGKSVLFFPARFDLPAVQALDGYAYWLAVQRHNAIAGTEMPPLVSTDAQGAWWGSSGGGTIPHALMACFFADTAEASKAFARHIPVTVPRIALVDFNNDTVRGSVETLSAFWPHYLEALKAGNEDGQKRWSLNGVRLDTSSAVRDHALEPGDPKGTSPLLAEKVRRALNNAWTSWDVSAEYEDAAKDFCKQVQIVVSGGFNREKIAAFEAAKAPVDSYGVGSKLMRNDSDTNTDYTMDVVRVKLYGEWVDMAKEGRQPCDNEDLQSIDLSVF